MLGNADLVGKLGSLKAVLSDWLNELAVHPPGELAVTMFIEIGESAQIKPVLDTLLGIDTGSHVRLDVVVDHPRERGRTVLSPAARRRLAEDLA
jgi:hypothetical protein